MVFFRVGNGSSKGENNEDVPARLFVWPAVIRLPHRKRVPMGYGAGIFCPGRPCRSSIGPPPWSERAGAALALGRRVRACRAAAKPPRFFLFLPSLEPTREFEARAGAAAR